MMTIIFFWGGGSFYPSNTLDRTLQGFGAERKRRCWQRHFPCVVVSSKIPVWRAKLCIQPIPFVFNVTKSLQGCYCGGDNEDTVFINAHKIISLAGAGAVGDCAVSNQSQPTNENRSCYGRAHISNSSWLSRKPPVINH